MSLEENSYGLAERQKELLDMMKDIDKLFRKNRIRYSLSCGTMLGAIRENGFIPWDDDIDIMMDRKNYNKAYALLTAPDSGLKYGIRREIWLDRIHLKDSTDEQDAVIDIFVMDRCPDNLLLRKIKVLLIKTLQGMMRLDYPPKDTSLFYKACLKVTHIMGLPFSSETKNNWYKAVSQIGGRKRTRYLTAYNDNFVILNARYDGDLMDSFVLHIFEDTKLPVVRNYHSYLRTHFGDDYMTPPPREERIPIHGGLKMKQESTV